MKGFWRGRSKAAKLDLYMRGTLYMLPWAIPLGLLAPVPAQLMRDPDSTALLQGLIAVVLVLCALSMYAMTHGFAHRLHGAPPPWRTAVVALLLGALVVVLAVALQTVGGLGDIDPVGADMVMFIFYGLLPAGLCVFGLSTVPRLLLGTAVAAVLTAVGVYAATGSQHLALPVALMFPVAALTVLGVYRPSLWFMAMIWELDRARDTEARLAVAEERLRFGRDLHDVMGRNLAVIALKSELAVQLAERGRPEAVAQMAEVQRIAQESQREVRAVVRGYREADLRNEIEGARGVLAAAGITCVVEDGLAADLPDGVQSALGWVVRETTTNVLRHGNPKSCTLRLTSDGVRAVLVVENDGAGSGTPVGPSGLSGSGLAGLRERLAAVGGSLVAGAAEDGLFRVRAEVPLTAPDDPASRVRPRTEEKVEGMAPESSAPAPGGTARLFGRFGRSGAKAGAA
ncbi:sensor histidine kinase [Streptomyces sp. NBC_00237]|uniref:sensor histidine kinase n=1 Tax=Streptomyces sp. NBC_00237 TaxID=2975687 RepID=UPI00225B7241|nr:sensor histidine kinase [Streptomyces sp. NBC_00237]MCX5199901.1 sensor histidine kinase [Streptomyces sp. NBC_00237]